MTFRWGNYLLFGFSWTFGHVGVRLGRWWCQIKAPWFPILFSERYRCGVRVLPLGFGWRITAKDTRRGKQ